MQNKQKPKALDISRLQEILSRINPEDKNLRAADLDAVVVETNETIREALVESMRNRPIDLAAVRTTYRNLMTPEDFEQFEKHVLSILVQAQQEASGISDDV